MSASADDGLLLERFLAGRDEAAFHRLYRSHAGAMYLLALRLLGGRNLDAEDVVQEAWLRIATGAAVFAGRSPLRTWLCGVIVNCARERRRKSGPPDPGETAGSSAPQDRIDLERAIRELPEGYRQVLVLHDLYGYTHEEIGAHLGIEEGTSKSQLARARRRVRERLGWKTDINVERRVNDASEAP